MPKPALQLCLIAFTALAFALAAAPAPSDAPDPNPVETTNRARLLPPPLPQPSTPVAYFRELLAMPPEERRNALAGRAEEQRKTLAAKLREYDQMPADVRELRLRHTELRWHLLALMPLRPEDCAARLQVVTADDRPIIDERLRLWDALPDDLRRSFLANQSVVAAYLEQGGAAPTNAPAAPNLDRQKKLEAELARLEAMPAQQKEQMCDLFRRFFQYTEKEKSNILSQLTDAQRRSMETAVGAYAGLDPEHQKKRLDSLGKLIRMTPAERQRFLDSAARWQNMPPSERAALRKTIPTLPALPPAPPGFFPAGKPPEPPAFPKPPARRPVAPPAIPLTNASSP